MYHWVPQCTSCQRVPTLCGFTWNESIVNVEEVLAILPLHSEVDMGPFLGPHKSFGEVLFNEPRDVHTQHGHTIIIYKGY